MKWLRILVVAATVSLAASAEDKTGTTMDATYWQERSPITVGVGAGLALLNGNTGWAINVNPLYRPSADLPLYVGADLGLNFWSFSSTLSASSSSSTGIQLLPTAIYGFGVPGWKAIHPYVGLSVGPNVFVERVTPVGATTSVSNTSVFFEALLRPGASFELTRTIALNVEPKLGILRSDFIFLPQVSAVFAL